MRGRLIGHENPQIQFNQLLMNSIHFLFIQIFTVLVLFLSSCHIAGNQELTEKSDLDGFFSQNIDIAFKECFPRAFSYQDTSFSFDEVIGSGAYGKVYSLKDPIGKISGESVAKVLLSSDYKRLEALQNQERALYELLPDFFVKTDLVESFQFKNMFGAKMFAAILVKNRVNGLTLKELVSQEGRSIISSPARAKRALDRLSMFTKELARELSDLTKQGIYVYDLHSANIMYDGSHWFLVDGLITNTRSDLSSYLDRPMYADQVSFDIVRKIDYSSEPLGSDFLLQLIQIQMRSDVAKLKDLSSPKN